MRRERTPEEKKVDAELEMLSSYLSQYRAAKRRKRALEQRLARIREEINHPLKGVGYSPISSPTGAISEGCASFTFRTAECEEKIYQQAEEAAKNLLAIMDILDYLEDADEKEALELYYIDRQSWEAVAEKMNISRGKVFKLRRAGLEHLLGYKRVRQILKQYAADLEKKAPPYVSP